MGRGLAGLLVTGPSARLPPRVRTGAGQGPGAGSESAFFPGDVPRFPFRPGTERGLGSGSVPSAQLALEPRERSGAACSELGAQGVQLAWGVEPVRYGEQSVCVWVNVLKSG